MSAPKCGKCGRGMTMGDDMWYCEKCHRFPVRAADKETKISELRRGLDEQDAAVRGLAEENARLERELAEARGENERLRGDFLDAAGVKADVFAQTRALLGRDRAKRECPRGQAESARDQARACLAGNHTWVEDYMGDPDVPGGTMQMRLCSVCGRDDHDVEAADTNTVGEAEGPAETTGSGAGAPANDGLGNGGPSAASDAQLAALPSRPRCGFCRRYYAVDFRVPNSIWVVTVKDVHTPACLECFIAMADERLLPWDREIEFFPVSLETHRVTTLDALEARGG